MMAVKHYSSNKLVKLWYQSKSYQKAVISYTGQTYAWAPISLSELE